MNEEKIILNFIVKDRIIKFDKSSLTEKVVGDNTGYVANFIFDEEWTNKVKTARFIKDGTYVDVLLDDNDQCDIPLEVLKSGTLEVGVFAGNLRSSTSCKVSIKSSILESNRLPAAPTDDVYAQIIEKVEAIESVKKAVINDDGILVITLTSGLELNVGQARGVGIKSFEQIKSSTEDSGENEFLVTLTDDTEFSFKIQNGSKGSKGDTGETPQLAVGTVTTVAPTESASASMTGTAEKPVLNLRIPKGSVGDGEVDPDKTTWMRRVYHNIFDKSTILDGYAYPIPVPANPLQLNKNDEYFTSDFIPVRQNTRYIVGGYNVPKGYGNYIVLKFFDKDKAYLGYQYQISIDTKMFTTPESTAFLRFSQRKGNGTADEIYLYEYINEIFPYTEYKTEYKILTCDDNYCDMIRDINTWDLLEKARLFVDDNKGVLSDEALKSGYWSILRMAGYTNIRGQLNRERMITNVGTLFFYPKEDAVIPKKVVFGLKPDEYFAINSEGSTLPEGGSAYNCEKYAGITDLILEYDGEYNKDFSMNVYPLKMLQNSLETLVLDKKGSIGIWSICMSDTLRKVVLYGKETPFEYGTFSYCPNLKSLHFPTGCADMVNSTIHGTIKLDDFTIGENYTGAIYLNGVLLATNPRITEILHKLIENLADLTSYTLTTEEPSDWSTNYTDYYTESDGVYTKVTDEVAPTWTENTYYSKNAGKAFVVGPTLLEKIDDEHMQMLETKNWQYS